jgi:hypothetical protein
VARSCGVAIETALPGGTREAVANTVILSFLRSRDRWGLCGAARLGAIRNSHAASGAPRSTKRGRPSTILTNTCPVKSSAVARSFTRK